MLDLQGGRNMSADLENAENNASAQGFKANEPFVSLIIRSKNEERWISLCLSAVFKQSYQNFEVIIVDNDSKDQTLAHVAEFPVAKVLQIHDYFPGKSLNMGIREAKGEFIVCLSGHCIPRDTYWLANLLRNFTNQKVAGVYGRQEALSMSSDSDKRDLALVFGLDRKIQHKDSFFHNANSMLRRSLWEAHPFDEKTTNIEDRIWAHAVLQEDYQIVYEPEASVYHWHGIHHDGNAQRAQNVTRIMKNLHGDSAPVFQPGELKIAAIIPQKGHCIEVHGQSLLVQTIRYAQTSKYIDRIFVLTDSSETAELARKAGAEVPFLRDPAYSEEYIDLEMVYSYSLHELEAHGIVLDLLVAFEPTFPFRKAGLADHMIEQFLAEGFDSVLAVKKEYKSIWKKNEDNLERIGPNFVPRQFKEPLYLGLRGICSITLPSLLRNGQFFGEKVGLFEISDPLSVIEVRNEEDLKMTEVLLESELHKDNKGLE